MPSNQKRPDRHTLILAAGKGTRMKSERPKVLHRIGGKPLIQHVLEQLKSLDITTTLLVLGHQAEKVEKAVSDFGVEIVLQREQLGTGHAIMAAKSQLEGLSGSLLVLYGDMPLIRAQELERLFQIREQEDADQVLLTAILDSPFGYGRILRNEQGEAIDIVEEQEATSEQKLIKEVNTGLNCFEIECLLASLSQLSQNNSAAEYYLTDLLRILRENGKKVAVLESSSPEDLLGINTREEMAVAEGKMRSQIARRWMLEGVTMLDPSSVYIEATVAIGRDTVLYPGVILEGQTVIGPGCTIRGFSHLSDATIGKGVVVDHCSVVRNSEVGDGSHVGPFAHLRANTVVAGSCRIGNFVELKNTRFGDSSKAAHLSYLGDTEAGSGVNIGAGTITCNYDGRDKHKTVIEDRAFIGSGTQLVAPVRVQEEAYVAAGSSITEDVPPQSLGIARSRQINKPGWGKKEGRGKGRRKQNDPA